MSTHSDAAFNRCHPVRQWSGSSSASLQLQATTRCWKGCKREAGSTRREAGSGRREAGGGKQGCRRCNSIGSGAAFFAGNGTDPPKSSRGRQSHAQGRESDEAKRPASEHLHHVFALQQLPPRTVLLDQQGEIPLHQELPRSQGGSCC